jgi:hypothetical protein
MCGNSRIKGRNPKLYHWRLYLSFSFPGINDLCPVNVINIITGFVFNMIPTTGTALAVLIIVVKDLINSFISVGF